MYFTAPGGKIGKRERRALPITKSSSWQILAPSGVDLYPHLPHGEGGFERAGHSRGDGCPARHVLPALAAEINGILPRRQVREGGRGTAAFADEARGGVRRGKDCPIGALQMT